MPTITQTNILSSGIARNKIRLIFNHLSNNGNIYGPFVEHRPLNDNITIFISGRESRLNNELNPPDYYSIIKNRLDTNIVFGVYDSLRKALKDIGSELVTLNDNIQMNVTYPTLTNPENVEDSIRTRIDNEMGIGVFSLIKLELKSMGITIATLDRKSDLIL